MDRQIETQQPVIFQEARRAIFWVEFILDTAQKGEKTGPKFYSIAELRIGNLVL